ncbi:TonB-dependent receptor [Adhaeribacter terreus]|uniref:TonB-dependent receptor n=1 Tax=Adhaeribacter terreus TaxID=529703 RepID=A0ABW0EC01_9BACT
MKIPFLLILFLTVFKAFPQNSLTGKITDQTTKQSIIGATVYLPDLRQGASTNAEGIFELKNLPKGKFLAQIRYVGYNSLTQFLEINGPTTLNFELTPSVTELGAVVITGVSASTQRHQNPVPTTVVNQEELQQRTATNVIDAIAKTPGISQISTGAAISKPVIRGLSGNRVVTLNNGMRQEGQQWGEEHGVEIDEFSVDRAEIVKGPGSIMYGSDAMAGVINFLSPDPVENGRIIGSYSGNFQTNNNLIGNSIFNAGNLNGLNWQARASHKIAGNYQNRYDGKVYNSGFEEKSASGYVGLNKSWGFSHLNFSTFNQKVGLIEGERDSLGNFLKLVEIDHHPEEVPVTDEDLKGYQINEPYQTINHLRFSSQNNVILGRSRATVNVDWQRNLRQEFGHAHAEEDHDHDHGDEPAEDASLIFDLQTWSFGSKYFLPEFSGWNATFGVSGMHQTNQNKGEEFLIPEYRLTDLGVFGFITNNHPTLHLSSGLRFDQRKLTSDKLLLTEAHTPTTNPEEAVETKFTGFSRSFSNISASAGATYDLSKKLTAKLNVARGFRAPNIAELASNGSHEGTLRYEIGNPDLKPETSLQFDAGLILETEHVNFEFTGFSNHIQQYIFPEKLRSVFSGDSISNPENPTATYKFTQGNAHLYGGEIMIDLHPHPLDWLHFENTFSFVRGKQLNQPDSTTNLPFIPAPRLQSEVRVNFSPKSALVKNWFARLEVERYFAQNHFYAANHTETATPGYTLFNLGAGVDVPNGKNATLFSLYVTANNLFDVAYQNHLSRLKYAAINEATGRTGVFNMGRNVSFKVIVPLSFK